MSPRTWGIAGAAVLLLASQSRAQTVYTWKDDKGVVNFSDENPEGVKGVEKMTLDEAPPLVSDEGAPASGAPSMVMTPAGNSTNPNGGANSDAGGNPGASANAGEQAPQGNPNVVLMGADLSGGDGTQRNVHGKIRNVGGEPAKRVQVRVVVADGDTGNVCITGELDASPATLGPGQVGSFDGQLDTPCFYGNPTVGYYPEWD